ncbi:hypothetical protein DUI87_06328 [Hirundo rustica rustica]|uniref:ribonuclease H n=1 Tax=Hirundo rustica rustica TaxID=333673 RepID=A0A3M0KUB7_HIRRU|nr:hypothetical protein DUI87_06328 [Hirundo rustica rustica]
MEQGTRCLRELAVLEIIFSEDERFPKSPDDVQCTSQMWLRFARLGPEMYSRYLATLQWREGEDKVGVLVNKLRIYEDTVTPQPFRTHVSSVETRLAEQVRSLIEEGHQKLKKELKEEIHHISPEPTKVSAIRSRYVGTESISISGVTGGSQQLTVLEAEVSLTGNGWQKHPIVTGPEAPCILGIDYLRNGYFKDPKGYRWAFGIAAVETEDIRQLSTLPGLSDDSCAVGLLRVEETTDYRALNEVTPPLSAAVPDMLELQYELESKAAKWYATIDIANAFFSIPLAAECRAQFAFTWKGVQYTWNRLPQGWKHSPTICHGLTQTALEKGEAPEHLQYIDDIIVWGNTAGEVLGRMKPESPINMIA